MDPLRAELAELWRTLNHWWMWLLIAIICLVEFVTVMGWLPPGTRLLPVYWW